MPSKKKKYNARFPAGRIKKIMQTDEEVGKVAQAVPVIISRTLELFVESLLKKSMQITQARSAKTLTPSHMKQCILSESRFDFLKDLVRNIPDASVQEDNENNALFEASIGCKQTNSVDMEDEDDPPVAIAEQPKPIGIIGRKTEPPSSDEQSTSSTRTPVIQYAPNSSQPEVKFNFSMSSLLQPDDKNSKAHQIVIKVPTSQSNQQKDIPLPAKVPSVDSVPPLIPIAQNFYNQNASDNLCIDDDYDN